MCHGLEAWNYILSMTKQHISGSVWPKAGRGRRRFRRAVCQSGLTVHSVWQTFSVKAQIVNILGFTDYIVSYSILFSVALGP